jgi:penicillin-binding protein 2
MAMVTATIANRGTAYEPKLVHRVLDQTGADVKNPDTGLLVAPHEPKVRADMKAAGVTVEQIELIREGMRRVVMDGGGTGRKAQIPGITVAGKTGTAQAWREENGRRIKDNKTWFITFAPYQEPKYAICVMVEAGKSGGGTSAPVAQKIMQESLALEKGWDPGLAWLEPAVGHLKTVEEVNYEKAALPTPDPEEEVDREETSDQDGPPVVKKTKKSDRQVQQTPDIRPKADQRGKVQKAPDRVRRAERVEERKNFFQRFFGPRRGERPAPSRQREGR